MQKMEAKKRIEKLRGQIEDLRYRYHVLNEPGVTDEVFRLIDLRAVGPILGVVLVIAGVDHEDVSWLDTLPCLLLPPLEMLRPVHLQKKVQDRNTHGHVGRFTLVVYFDDVAA